MRLLQRNRIGLGTRPGSALAALFAAILCSRDAVACSCGEPTPQRRIIPSDGSSNVPTDAILRVFLHAFPSDVRAAIAQEYRLRDESGAEVSLQSSFDLLRLDLRPRTRLRPNTRYVLEQLFAFDAAGNRLDDTERQRAPRTGLRRAWFAVVSFRTSHNIDDTTRMGAATIAQTSLDFRSGGGDCGPGMAVGTRVRLPSSMRATDFVRLEVRGPRIVPMIVDSAPIANELFLGANNLLCTADPVTVPYYSGLELRAVLLNAAGSEIGTTAWTSTQRGRYSAPAVVVPVEEARVPITATANADWLAPPIVTPNLPRIPRPEQCPHGLEVRQRSVLTEHATTPGYEEYSTLVQTDRWWFALPEGRDEARTQLFSFTANEAPRSYPTRINGRPHSIASNGMGLLLANHTYDRHSRSSIELHAITAEGTLRWSRVLPRFGRHPSLAVGAGHVLVSYTVEEAGVFVAIVDESSGALRVAPVRIAAQELSEVFTSAAFVDGHFVVLWNPSNNNAETLRVVSIATDGTRSALRELSIPNHGPLDVVVAGNQLGLATATNNGHIEWRLLDARGAILRGPSTVSTGRTNRKPRITFRDGLFSIAWETYPESAIHATVVDLAGRIAPATVLTINDEGGVPILLRNADQSFTASYSSLVGNNYHLLNVSLACRATPAPGAPTQIAPVAQ